MLKARLISAAIMVPLVVYGVLRLSTGQFALLLGAVLLAGAVLFWFVRRDRGEEDEEWSSTASEASDLDETAFSTTEALPAPSHSAFSSHGSPAGSQTVPAGSFSSAGQSTLSPSQ